MNYIFKDLSVTRGNKHNYLGMVFNIDNNKKSVEINMNSYINEIVKYYEIDGVAVTPVNKDLFVINADSKLLSSEEKKLFHSMLAKVMYLAKRVRPECLVACSFLASRVNVVTEEDMSKLIRLLKYLNGTKDIGLRLMGDNYLTVIAFIDASFGVHMDFKSHTGIAIVIGKGVIFAKSTKQKLNSKSSTEAELIAVSDGIGQVIWIRIFLINQGYKINEVIIMQDNKSTITMITNGTATSPRTRHVAVRFFFVKDRMDKKEIKLDYISTNDMLADILTKPLQGSLFKRLRDQLLGAI